MPFPLIPAGTKGGYTIAKSLRFRSSASAYLSRTPGAASNRKTWTWSGWVKRGLISGSATYEIFQGDNYSTSFTGIRFSNDALVLQDYVATTKNIYWTTSAVFRDPSAWYHVVIKYDTTQASSANAVAVYVNGVSQTLTFTAATGAYVQNYDGIVNSTSPQKIGALSTLNYFDGYLSEINFIDGQALDPTYFGQTDTATGVWMPKAYTGSYGTNGFYLKFADASAATAAAIGKDSSGNGNNWTPNNISVTAGVTYDSMVDTPTNYDNGGNGAGNYAVLNPLCLWQSSGTTSVTNGNLYQSTTTSAATGGAAATIAISSGKFYWEVNFNVIPSSSTCGAGLYDTSAVFGGANSWVRANHWILGDTGLFYANGAAGAASGTGAFAAGDVAMFAFDAGTGNLWVGKNGTWVGTPGTSGAVATISVSGKSFAPIVSTYSTSATTISNFGQQPWDSRTSGLPTGFKALCTQNLPTPTIGATSSTLANKYFDVALDTGANIKTTSQALYTYYLEWIKDRANTNNHQLADTVRGNTAIIQSNTTAAETTYTAPSGNSVGWVWNAGVAGTTGSGSGLTSITNSANTTAGFSVTTYTGNGTAGAYFNHGLGVAPKFIIVKMRNATQDWIVFHQSIGNTQAVFLQSTAAAATSSLYWYNTTPTSSVVTLGSGNGVNQSSSTYVAYCFAEVAGYSRFGSYTGNGSADGPFCYTGFRPKYIMVKRTDAAGASWIILDSARVTYNADGAFLSADTSSAENTGYDADFLANGWKIRNTSTNNNASGGTYIYAAFCEQPFNFSRAR